MIIAYVAGDPVRHLSGQITDWNGNRLGFWERQSVWRRRGRDGGRDHMVALRAYISTGNYAPGWYHGRVGIDWNQSIRLYPLTNTTR